MAGYPKIWTTLWSSPEFRALSGSERGVLMQLILWCKHERDDGLVLAESYANLGAQLGFSRQTASRMIVKLDAAGYIEVSKTDHEQLIIRLPMYDESQKLTAKEASKRRRNWPGQPSNMDGEKSTTRPEQTRADQSRPEKTAANPELEIRTKEIREIINHSEFQIAVGHKLSDPIGWVRRMVEHFREPDFPDDQIERGLESLFEHQRKNGWPVPVADRIRVKVWEWIERQVDNRSTAQDNKEDEYDRICRERRERQERCEQETE